MKTTTKKNYTKEEQLYIDARILMMNCERRGKIITLKEALKKVDW